MRVVIDTETNSLTNPTKVWVIVCKDIDTGVLDVFREPSTDQAERSRFIRYAAQVTYWVGHNWLEYDYPCLNRLLGLVVPEVEDKSLDTLILSRLVDYSRKNRKWSPIPNSPPAPDNTGSGVGVHTAGHGFPGVDELGENPLGVVVARLSHSIESYGEEFGFPKIKFSDFDRYSKEMEEYCVRDVEICGKIYTRYLDIIRDPQWADSILVEHQFQRVVNDLHTNGFSFNVAKATKMLEQVQKDLAEIDIQFVEAFPPRETLIREFTPRLTKFGTVSRTSVPRQLWTSIPSYVAGQTYRHTKLQPFNPSSHKQVIEVLNSAGWRPVDKTQTHIDTEREL